MRNIFDLSTLDFSGDEEITEILSQGKGLRIERIVSCGQVSEDDFWYDQPEHEFVMVLQGEAKIMFENRGEQFLHQGDYLVIPPHQKHRVVYTSVNPKCIWLAVFFSKV